MATLSEIDALTGGVTRVFSASPNVFHTALNANLLNTTINDTGWIDLHAVDGGTSKQYADIVLRIEGNTAITAGQIVFEGAMVNTAASGVTLQYEQNGGSSFATVAIGITSSSLNTFYVANPDYRYIKARISTAFTGAATGARVVAVSYLPRNVSSDVVRAIITGTPAVTISGTASVNANGNAAHSAGDSGNPVKVGGRVRTANDTTLVANDRADNTMTTGGYLITYPSTIPEVQWNFSTLVTSTTNLTLQAAPGAGLRHYITGVQIFGTGTASAYNECSLGDATVPTVVRINSAGRAASTTAEPWQQTLNFNPPLRLPTANAAALFSFLSSSGTPSHSLSVQGFVAP